ncbi:VOC family protein [Sorangium sp. So ce1128]
MSDSMPGTPAPKESNTQVCLHFDDVAETTKAFDARAAGGTVTTPLHDTLWGAT